jgi:hypothetical protein
VWRMCEAVYSKLGVAYNNTMGKEKEDKKRKKEAEKAGMKKMMKGWLVTAQVEHCRMSHPRLEGGRIDGSEAGMALMAILHTLPSFGWNSDSRDDLAGESAVAIVAAILHCCSCCTPTLTTRRSAYRALNLLGANDELDGDVADAAFTCVCQCIKFLAYWRSWYAEIAPQGRSGAIRDATRKCKNRQFQFPHKRVALRVPRYAHAPPNEPPTLRT